jgi:hypothetical protein
MSFPAARAPSRRARFSWSKLCMLPARPGCADAGRSVARAGQRCRVVVRATRHPRPAPSWQQPAGR